ncbi:tetratricopeptide repeat protein [Aliarcobacter cryaerophilus]|uniref:tetratricopeptide repeat protein n=1 Tax=Aliarcobacter cryaerophilus TaxID=28198 RepID=UPI0019D304B9|nr:tetratricopeptide repeat protein [Aliarcobacter cryaerophilus]
MFKKLIFGLGVVTTLLFGATLEDGVNAANKGDFKTAFTIWQDFALKGDSSAQFNLGIMYYNGYGVNQDYLKAKEWFEKAAAQGLPEA